MAENFPEDTDEHVIQVVLAMINAVRGRRMVVGQLMGIILYILNSGKKRKKW